MSIMILAFAVVPIISMTTSGRHAAAMTEYHVLAHKRAQRILEVYQTVPFAKLARQPTDDEGNLIPPFREDSTAFPAEYRKSVESYREQVSYVELNPALGMIRVEIQWTMAGKRKRTYTLHRFYGDETLSLTDQFGLRN